jgi:hypothetical protein
MNRTVNRRVFLQSAAAGLAASQIANAAERPFQAGAAAVDISPVKFPAIISGGFLQKTGNQLVDPLFVRCLVLDDGTTRLAIVVVDTLFVPRELADQAKRQAERATGIRADRILISAIHTHSAPSVAACLGTGIDEDYAPRLAAWIVQSIVAAVKNLRPARIGWTVTEDRQHTHCRRWIYRPDRMQLDPFGEKSVRAMMHPGYQNPDCVGPAGAVDPGLSILAVQSPEGRPIAMLANYSMHYVGAHPVSADYFGIFCREMGQRLGGQDKSPVIAIMSQGTAGDLHWMDYSQPKKAMLYAAYASEMAEVAFAAYQKIEYRNWVPLAMAEDKLTLRRRVPDEKRLAWTWAIVADMKGRTVPANKQEVYALEQVLLHETPQRELVLQAIRVGDLGITAIPNEVFGITGLKLKAQSPLQPTFNIELANGCEGYIPPPEQHPLGGYTTWPARSAGLEVQAEPKIVERVLRLLEQVAGKPRRPMIEAVGPYAAAVIDSRPAGYWRLGDAAGPQAVDASPHNRPATYENGIALYLEGPEGAGFCGPAQAKHAAHLAGGRLMVSLPGLGPAYTFEAWFWNGLPSDARPVAGYLFSCTTGDTGDVLGIGGTEGAAGKLFFAGSKSSDRLAGSTEIALRTWNHVALVRDGQRLRVYLNGKSQPEIAAEAVSGTEPGSPQIFVGGRSDGSDSFEGKLAEVAVYDRALGVDEIVRHYAAAGKR